AAVMANAAPQITIAPDRASGVYDPNRQVTWTIHVADDKTPSAGKVDYHVRKGGLTEIAAGTLELKDGAAQVSATRADPGTLLLAVQFKPAGADKELVKYGGAAFAPEQIKASMPPPDDFDAFWKAKIADLDAVPMNVKVEPIDSGDKNIEYFKITLDNIHGAKIYGQLAKPAGKADLPALLQVQWAGVYPLHKDWVIGHARAGWMSFNISAHDLPIDKPEEFYKAQQEKELKDYPGIGNDDRETSYFLRMFLSCRRAVDYLTQRPDWNQKTLIVHGGSQGGYQTIVTAGLCPAVTAIAANVPAGCDHTGKQAGRAPGWPDWASRTWQGKDAAKMLNTARYFDAMNFATRVKCPALIGLGLSDTVCPAEGVLATCNQLAGPKKLVIMPEADHGGDHKAFYAAFGPFLEAHKAGEKK
ncbi:MAG TPA: acetylxylan esterase, partial [Pirellulales bacterium]|nr:acetylxylan esterase [Pirellulales bacterium]